jgi:chemotaxis protein MotB
MRSRKAAAHVNHERWLVSYADFITLLFAFFVVMFASTQSDKNKAKAFSDSVREALEHGQFSTAISTVLGRGRHEAHREILPTERVSQSENRLPPIPPESKPPTHPADLTKSLDTLQQGLAAELKSGKVQLKLEGTIPWRPPVSPSSPKSPPSSRISRNRCAWKVIRMPARSTTRASAAIGNSPRRAPSP